LVDVGNGTNVHLVGGSFNPNPNVTARGLITAVKIRNHVDQGLRLELIDFAEKPPRFYRLAAFCFMS